MLLSKVLRAITASLLPLIVSGCGGSATPKTSSVKLSQDTEMRVGRTQRLVGTSEYVTFVQVSEDERCPINITAEN